MKSRLTYIGLLAFALGACTTGSYVTSSYTDDIYFNPGDVPPPIVIAEKPDKNQVKEKSGERIILSEIENNDDGTNTMNNYIFDGTEKDADALRYNMEQMELEGSDTTVYYNDDEVQYVINNYYDGDEMDYAYRIRRFHNPYYYDPFYWDSWAYDPFYGFGYSSWYDPFYYSYSPWGWGGYGWYSPYSRWGWGYYPYYSYYSPYYYGGYYGWGYPYYNNYYGYGGYYGSSYNRGWYANSGNYDYGKRRSTGTNVMRNDGRRTSGNDISAISSGRNKSTAIGRTGDTNVGSATRRTSSNSGLRESATRDGVQTKSVTTRSANVLTEKRRTSEQINPRSVNTVTNQDVQRTQSYTRPGTSTQSRNYTRPSSSSSGINNNYTQPRVVTKSATNNSVYSQPKSTSSYNRTYRSSSTYNQSSSSGSSSRSYRAPSSTGTSSYKSSSTYSGSSSRSSGSSYSGSSGVSRSSGSSGSGSSGGGSRSSGGGSSSSGRR